MYAVVWVNLMSHCFGVRNSIAPWCDHRAIFPSALLALSDRRAMTRRVAREALDIGHTGQLNWTHRNTISDMRESQQQSYGVAPFQRFRVRVVQKSMIGGGNIGVRKVRRYGSMTMATFRCTHIFTASA